MRGPLNRHTGGQEKRTKTNILRRRFGLARGNKTKSSATAEIARDADDVDYKSSEVTVHLTKNANEYHPKNPNSPIITPKFISTENFFLFLTLGRHLSSQGTRAQLALPAPHIQRLQSVQNAPARLIFNRRRCDHITDALISLHWLRVPERITFKVAILTYSALHGSAPPYLASSFTCVADMLHRRRLRSASTDRLDVPTCRLSTVGDRAFPVASAKVWNGLPSDVTSASSLAVFKNRLKTYLFRRCYETV